MMGSEVLAAGNSSAVMGSVALSLMKTISKPLLVVKANAKNAAIKWDSEWQGGAGWDVQRLARPQARCVATGLWSTTGDTTARAKPPPHACARATPAQARSSRACCKWTTTAGPRSSTCARASWTPRAPTSCCWRAGGRRTRTHRCGGGRGGGACVRQGQPHMLLSGRCFLLGCLPRARPPRCQAGARVRRRRAPPSACCACCPATLGAHSMQWPPHLTQESGISKRLLESFAESASSLRLAPIKVPLNGAFEAEGLAVADKQKVHVIAVQARVVV